MHQTTYRYVFNYKLQITAWPHESHWFCNDLALSDPTIAMATACCLHMYKQLVIESDGDSFLGRERRLGTRVGKDRRGENMRPRQIPQRTIYSYGWIHCHSQILTPWMCVCACVCWRQWNAEWFQRALKLPWIQFSVPARVITGEGLFFGVCKGKHWVSAFWVI